MKDNKYNKWYLLLTIFAIIFMFFGGTLAYFRWTTNTEQRTNIVLTVTPTFMCEADGGGDLTSDDISLVPTDCTNSDYAIQREIKVSPTIYGEYAITMDLWLDIKSIGNELKNSNNFKYALTTDPDSCTNGLVKSGNFKDKGTGSKVELFNYMGYTQSTTDTFYLYVWLDKEETSTSTMNQSFSLSLNGMCTDAPKPDTYIVYNEEDTTLRLYKNNSTASQVSNNIDSKSNISRLDNNIERIEDLTITDKDKRYFDLENSIYSSEEQLPWYEYRDSITRVIFEDEIKPKSTAYWFKDLKNVEYIDVSKLNTLNVTNMKSMFNGAGYNITEMFEIVGLENWNTSNVIDMSDLFSQSGYSAISWNIGNLSLWNVSNVTNMGGMFYKSGYTSTIWNIGDLSNWNVSNVTNMNSMFNSVGYNVINFNLDLSNWDTSNVTSMSGMFYRTGYNVKLFNIGDLSNWDTSNVTNMGGMFESAGNKATTWFIGNLSKWDTSRVYNMSSMFRETGKNAETFNLDLSNWNVSNVKYAEMLFYSAGQNALTWSVGDLSNWNVSNVTGMRRMFQSAGNKATSWSIGDISKWDVSNVTDMEWMFCGAGSSATNWSLDLSGWDVSKVTSHDPFTYDNNKITSPIWNTSS